MDTVARSSVPAANRNDLMGRDSGLLGEVDGCPGYFFS